MQNLQVFAWLIGLSPIRGWPNAYEIIGKILKNV
jgi:hypothetical protein